MVKGRLIDGVHKGKHRASPHSFWALCGPELAKVFSEIIYDTDLLSKCYCDIRSRDFDEEFIAEITTGIPGVLICSGDMRPDEFLSKNLPISSFDQPYLLVNDVGTGKTTYLYHYFLVTVKEYRLDNLIDGILINVREFGEGEDIPYDKLEKFIHNKIHEHLTHNYRDISSPDIPMGEMLFEYELIPYSRLIDYKKARGRTEYEAFVFTKIDSLVSDTKVFNRARLRYLNSIGKKIYIVIDNVDHFGRKTQERIFGLSTKLMNELGNSIIMSARDYTLPSAFRHVPLSAFEPRFLHLALPDTSGILQKRISHLFESDFIGKIFKIVGKDQIEIYAASGVRYVFDQNNLHREFQTIMDALLGGDKIVDMLENLSDYDMRAMLKMVKVALSSGYLFPDDREKRDRVRARDFLRAIMCGNNPFYFPNDPSCMVLNVFDNGEPDYSGNNLLRLRSLQTMKACGDNAALEEVVDYMESLGYHKERVKKVLQLLIEWDLVESSYHEGSNIERDDIKVLKLTFAGQYYLNNLIYNDIYLGEVKNSTYLDNDFLEKIMTSMAKGRDSSLAREDRILNRLNATELFIEFLRRAEEEEEKNIKSRGQPISLTNYEQINGITAKIEREFAGITDRILSSLD